MENKFNIDDGDILSIIHDFELQRGEDSNLIIRVFEPVAGDSKHKFIAFPTDGKTDEINDKFIGKGNTLIDAINNCLSAISGLDVNTIIYKSFD